MFSYIDGKKSYIGAAILFVIGGLLYIGAIDEKQAEAFAIMAGGFLGYSLRRAVKKIE